MTSLKAREWAGLARAADAQADRRIIDFFAEDADRPATFRVEAAGLHYDYSRALLSGPARTALLEFAAGSDLEARRDAMFAGAPVNTTEGRAANHMALRAATPPPEVVEETARVSRFADEVRSDGTRDVLWIGIGGSDLGPRFVCDSLSHLASGPAMHFVSNVDDAGLDMALAGLDPATTRIVMVSKSFTTLETMINMTSARAWMSAALGEAETDARIVAVTAASDKAVAFGIAPERIFAMWDWVGGRFSLWSAVGVAMRISLGNPAVEALLAGGRAMDTHFREAPLARNVPVLMALMDIWNVNFLKLTSLAICAYSARMGLLVPYLQQLIMESNGKRVSEAGEVLAAQGAPVIWGVPGTDCQHSVFQWLHQSPAVAPVEFLLPVAAKGAREAHREALIGNCLAQASALMLGRDAEATAAMGGDADLVAHRVFPGNRPSTLMMFDDVTPARLGALIALYEHRAAAQAAMLGFNAFDQWGVEFGKTLAGQITPLLSGDGEAPDPATAASIAEIGEIMGQTAEQAGGRR